MNSICIFGASGGVGSELVRQLSLSGWQCLLAGRNVDRLQALASEFDTSWTAADVTDATQAADACARTVDTFGSLDAVVNLAGSLYLKPAHRTPPEDFEKVIRTNLISAFNAVRAAVGHMPKGGSIVLVSTVAAQLGLPNHEAIAAAKAGVEGLTRAAAASYATKGIRVNAVAPSLTDTPLTAALTGHEATLKASTAMHPLGRIGTAQDIASAIAWLLDPSTNWVTGQVIPVDGGLSTLRVR